MDNNNNKNENNNNNNAIHYAEESVVVTMDKAGTLSPMVTHHHHHHHHHPQLHTSHQDQRNCSRDTVGSDSPTLSCTTMSSSVILDDVVGIDVDGVPQGNHGELNPQIMQQQQMHIQQHGQHMADHDYDEDSERLTPMEARMGRTIEVTTMDEEEEYQPNPYSPSSSSSSPRTSHDQNDHDDHQYQYYQDRLLQEDYERVLEALETLSKFAAMESSIYQERLVERSLPRISSYQWNNNNNNNSNNKSTSPPRRRLVRRSSRGTNHHHHHNDSQDEELPLPQKQQQQQHQLPPRSNNLDLPQYQMSSTSCTATTTTTNAAASSLSSSSSSSCLHPQQVIARLSQSIHRFHSLVINLTRENDSQTLELVELQRALEVERTKRRKWQTAAKTLHTRTIQMAEQLAHNKTIGRQLVERVTKQKQERKEEQHNSTFWKMACQVSQHEQVLLLKQRQVQQQQQQVQPVQAQPVQESKQHRPGTRRDGSLSPSPLPPLSITGTRERIHSNMSSDTMDGLQDFVNCSVDSGTTQDLNQMLLFHSSCDGVTLSNDGGEDIMMFPRGDVSVASQQSLVTDDGVATVRFQHRERTMTWPNVVLHVNKRRTNSDGKVMATPDRLVATATEAANKEMTTTTTTTTSSSSLWTIDKSVGTTTSNTASPTISSNPFAAFLSPMKFKPQPYTLSLVAPCVLQLVQLPLETTSAAPLAATADGAVVPVATTTTTTTSTSTSTPGMAYAICGYHGFDAIANVKPTLGGRLLKIGGVEIEGNNKGWNTVEDIQAAIVAQGPHVSLSFRNDHWNKTQKELLQAAVAQQVRLYPTTTTSTTTTTGFMDAADQFFSKPPIAPSSASATKKRTNSSDGMMQFLTGGTVGCAKNNNNSEPQRRRERAPSPIHSNPNVNLLGFLNFNHHHGGQGHVETKTAAAVAVPTEATPFGSSFNLWSSRPGTPVQSLPTTTKEVVTGADEPLQHQATASTEEASFDNIMSDADLCVVEPQPLLQDEQDTTTVNTSAKGPSGTILTGTHVTQEDDDEVGEEDAEVMVKKPIILSSSTTMTPPRKPAATQNHKAMPSMTPPPSAEKFMKNMGKLFAFGN
jgi:hypothetical protein